MTPVQFPMILRNTQGTVNTQSTVTANSPNELLLLAIFIGNQDFSLPLFSKHKNRNIFHTTSSEALDESFYAVRLS